MIIYISGSMHERGRQRLRWIAGIVRRLRPNDEVALADEVPVGSLSVSRRLNDLLADAGLFIIDLTENSTMAAYEAGLASAAGKPTVLLSAAGEQIGLDLARQRVLMYTPFEEDDFFVKALDSHMAMVLRPHDAPGTPEASEVDSVFISYSHADSAYLNRLLVHLRPLEREGVLSLWADTQLVAGDLWRDEIEDALTRARVAVLLVSPDFLASDFIISHELPRLLQQAQAQGTRIIPVILKPCRFTRDRSLRAFQAINDPAQPMSALDDGEREAVYDRVAATVEQVLGYSG